MIILRQLFDPIQRAFSNNCKDKSDSSNLHRRYGWIIFGPDLDGDGQLYSMACYYCQFHYDEYWRYFVSLFKYWLIIICSLHVFQTTWNVRKPDDRDHCWLRKDLREQERRGGARLWGLKIFAIFIHLSYLGTAS